MAYTPAQKRVIKAIRREAVRRYSKGGWTKAEKRKLRSAFMVGRVESNFQNLGGGDADSAGWRQERASLYPNPTNLKASTRRYFNEADELYQGDRPASLAGRVQRPASQYLYRYGEHKGEAKKLARATRRGGAVGAPQTRREGHTKLKRVPGVDRSSERRALLMQYLGERDRPDALLNLAKALPATASTPSRLKAVKVKGQKPMRPERGGKVHGGGGWGGSKNIVMHAVKGLPVSNFKRTPSRNAAVGGSPTSEHLTTDLDSYAADVPFGSGKKIAKRLGIKGYKPGSYRRYVITAAGGRRFSVQILSQVEGHWDHDHLGVDAL